MDIFTSLTEEEIAHSKRTAEISRILAEHADYDLSLIHISRLPLIQMAQLR